MSNKYTATEVLQQLGLGNNNPGASIGCHDFNSTGDSQLSVYTPINAEKIAEINLIDQKIYDEIVTRSQAAFLKWREVPAPVRGECIRKIAIALRKEKENLAKLISLEMGKINSEALGEVQEMIDIADYAVGLSRMLYGKTMPSERPSHRLQEQWHPLGITAVISAFNFPVAVWAWNAFIAAVCGNTVIWKPSHKTPLCAIAVHKLCAKILKPMGHEEIFSYILPNPATKAEIAKDQRIPLVSFTGSTAAGRHVASEVAKRLGKTILELGGNNALIVDESADQALALTAILFGSVGTAGQRCTSTRRVFIHENIYKEICKKLQLAYQQIRVGDPLDTEIHMGPLIDQSAVQLYEKTIAQLRLLGANVLTGGSSIEGPGYFVTPCLIENISNESPIVQEEVFAPITYLIPFKTIKEAITLQNNTKYGLSSALFSKNQQHAELFLSAIGSDCGLANINIGTSGAEIGGAFGGEKDTGGGRESGSDAWKAYMRRQTNTINWGDTLPLAQGIKFLATD